MKTSSRWFRIFAVLLALALVGGYVYQMSGGNLLADTGLDRVLPSRPSKIAELEQKIDRLEHKIDVLLSANGCAVAPVAVISPSDPAATPPSLMYGSKSAPMFMPDPSSDGSGPVPAPQPYTGPVDSSDPFAYPAAPTRAADANDPFDAPAPASAPGPATAPQPTAPTATNIFYLKFAKSEVAAELLREAMPKGAANPPQIVPDVRLNALLVKAEAGDLDVVEQLLKVIDQPTRPPSESPSNNPAPNSAAPSRAFLPGSKSGIFPGLAPSQPVQQAAPPNNETTAPALRY